MRHREDLVHESFRLEHEICFVGGDRKQDELRNTRTSIRRDTFEDIRGIADRAPGTVVWLTS